MSRILLVGGAGCIGIPLTRALLAQGARVRVLDNHSRSQPGWLQRAFAGKSPQPELIRADMRQQDACLRACESVDMVIHLAAPWLVPPSFEHPWNCAEQALLGTMNLLDAMRQSAVERLLFTSSSAVYGETESIHKHEDQRGELLSPQGVWLRAMEEYIRLQVQHWGTLRAIGLRLFHVYGPYQRTNGIDAPLVGRLLGAYLRGEAPQIHDDGHQSRDFTFVDDAVALILSMIARPFPDPGCTSLFNLGSGERISLNELDDALRRTLREQGFDQLPVRPEAVQPGRPGSPRHMLADIRRIREAYDYQPEVSLREGLRRTLAWHLSARQADEATFLQ